VLIEVVPTEITSLSETKSIVKELTSKIIHEHRVLLSKKDRLNKLRLEQLAAAGLVPKIVSRVVPIIHRSSFLPKKITVLDETMIEDDDNENEEKTIVADWVKRCETECIFSITSANIPTPMVKKIKIKKVDNKCNDLLNIKPLIAQRREERSDYLKEKCKVKSVENTDYALHYSKRCNGFDILKDKNVMAKKLEKTKMCISISTGKKCPHGIKCRFAHSVEELCNICMFGSSCKNVKKITKNNGSISFENRRGCICLFKHPEETNDNFLARTDKGKKAIAAVIVPMVPIVVVPNAIVVPAIYRSWANVIKGIKTSKKEKKSRWGVYVPPIMKKSRWGVVKIVKVHSILMGSMMITIAKLKIENILLEAF
jgi:hypothetical protein